MGKAGVSKYQTLFKLGEKYNDWEIVGNVVVENEAKVEVRCKCGKVLLVSCYSIVKNTSKGCLDCSFKAKEGAGNPAFVGYGIVPGRFANRFIKKKSPKEPCTITAKDIEELYFKQHQKCALTGLPISFENTNIRTRDLSCTASIDRIDSSRGYTLGNIQLVHKDVNTMKNAFEQEYFIKMCKLIVSKSEVR
jgi:hypothetical protein